VTATRLAEHRKKKKKKLKTNNEVHVQLKTRMGSNKFKHARQHGKKSKQPRHQRGSTTIVCATTTRKDGVQEGAI
jgi:hypothetical protein